MVNYLLKKFSQNSLVYLSITVLAHVSFGIWSYSLGSMYALFSGITGLLFFHLGFTLYVHRTLSHGHFRFSNNIHKVLGLIFSTLNLGSISANVIAHTQHHKHSDDKGDPHDFRQIGILRVMLKAFEYDKFATNKRAFISLFKKPFIKHNYNKHLQTALLVAIIFPILPIAGFWLINMQLIVVHLGKDAGKRAINIPILNPIMWGDEMHRLHHQRPSLAKHSNFDYVFYIGKTLQYVSSKLSQHQNKGRTH